MAVKRYYVTVDDQGNTVWYKDAKCSIRHRENGPAQEWNGAKFWYQNGQYHRTDGPAIEWWDGDKHWFHNGQRHRTDGPAIERSIGRPRWFIHGVEMSESEFLAATQPTVEMTVADVEKLLGKRVKIIK